MNARSPSSSPARHWRRSHDGGEKLAYSRGTIASANSSNKTWTIGCRESDPTAIANSRMATRPPKPRLKERSRQACTAGRVRAAIQKRMIGSPTQADQTAIKRMRVTIRTVREAAKATAETRKPLAAANDPIAATCQRRGRGMSESRYRSSA